MALYDNLVKAVGPRLAEYYYNIGRTAYFDEDYDTSIPNLQWAYQYNSTNNEALFYLGNSYRGIGELDTAKEIYAQVIDNFPGTRTAAQSETNLAEINNAEQQN